ncbi:hypothetical protein BP6252_11013 [Coleophoma cylindrospora]|uniref:Nephrocystin 3-like N-terminal domain-containing protein n=1 Tax=Coleophoma cylindrospora TaxID=1849047 RepID=A0A3D8QP59_9HELO|nr:hypothetical protein BP6252_11013 [Coleophoma cylindrospora]
MASTAIVGNTLSGHARQYAGEVYEENHNTIYTLSTRDILSGKRSQSSKERCRHELVLTNPSEDRGRIITAKGTPAKGTCKWIEEVQQFKDWLKGEIQFLWIFGGPGKGKTFLSIHIVKHLVLMKRRLNLNTKAEPLVLEYYCDNSDSQRNTALCVLRGLLYQLLDADDNLYDLILPDFDALDQGRQGLFSEIHIEKLWRIFLTMLKRVERQAYLVLDGLDECDDKSIRFIRTKLQELHEVSETEAGNISTILISRRTLDEDIRVAGQIDLDKACIEEREDDIKLFISDSIEQLHLDPEHQLRLEDIFQARAEGTYLWVALALSVLKTRDNLQRILESDYVIDELLPTGLDKIYSRILLAIPEGERELSAKIIKCLSVAYRSLSEVEITAMTGADHFQVQMQIKDRTNLLTHPTNGRIQLIHLSLKEYLQQAPSIWTLVFTPRMKGSLLQLISFVLDKRLLCGLLDFFLLSVSLIFSIVLLRRSPVSYMPSLFFTGVAMTLLSIGKSSIAFNVLLGYRRRLIISCFTFRKQEEHQKLLATSLGLMKAHFHDENRHIPKPGTLAAEIKDADLNKYIPTAVQYGCQFWTRHFLDSSSELLHHGVIHSFLKDEFLCWLEAMGLMKLVGEAIKSISSLASYTFVSSVGPFDGDV